MKNGSKFHFDHHIITIPLKGPSEGCIVTLLKKLRMQIYKAQNQNQWCPNRLYIYNELNFKSINTYIIDERTEYTFAEFFEYTFYLCQQLDINIYKNMSNVFYINYKKNFHKISRFIYELFSEPNVKMAEEKFKKLQYIKNIIQ